MKKPIRFTLAAFVVTVVGIVAATLVANALSGTPEIDRANARMQLSATLTSQGCVGEDNTDYVTFSGSMKGGESQVVPDATDYPLTGQVAVTGIKWTINSNTKRGVLTSRITLTKATPAAVVTVYSGAMTLVTQGMPSSSAAVLGRGWINASMKLPDEGATPEDFLIANTEFKISTSSAMGQFGDLAGPSFGTKNLSVVTNVAPVAADGTC